MAGILDPFTPGDTTDPLAGIADPNTYAKVRGEWDSFIGNPQGRAALLSTGLALMQPPSFGDTPMSQIGRAIGAAGQSATANQAMDLKEAEAGSKADLRMAQGESAMARASAAEARAAGAEGRLGMAGANLELKKQQLEAMQQRNLLGNRVRLSGMYQTYVKDVAKRNQEKKLLGTGDPEPVMPINDWIAQNPMLKSMGLVEPAAGATGSEDDDISVPAAAQTTSGGTVQPAPPPAQRQVGATYQTPKGPLKWTGTGWVTP